MRYGVMTDYDYNSEHKRERLTIWSGSFYSDFEGVAYSLLDGYMITTYSDEKVRVACPTPRTEDNYQQIDKAISDTLNSFYKQIREA